MTLELTVGTLTVGLLAPLVLGFLLGTLAGLYHGERGRNRDLREVAELRLERERPKARAFVRDPSSGELVEVDEDKTKEPILTAEERDRMAKDLVEESPAPISMDEARAEVDRILGEAAAMGHGHG